MKLFLIVLVSFAVLLNFQPAFASEDEASASPEGGHDAGGLVLSGDVRGGDGDGNDQDNNQGDDHGDEPPPEARGMVHRDAAGMTVPYNHRWWCWGRWYYWNRPAECHWRPRPPRPPTAWPPTAWPPTARPPTRWPPTRRPPTVWPPTRRPPTVWPPTRRPPTVWPPTRRPPAPGGCTLHLTSWPQANWFQAQGNCARQGMTLANLKTTFDQNRANAKFAHVASYWIGASDNGREGVWKWTDGTRVRASAWGWGEPNGGPLVNCAQVNYGGVGKWDDAPCGDVKPYVCQRCPYGASPYRDGASADRGDE